MYPRAWSAETIHGIPADRNDLLPGMERVAAVQEGRMIAPHDAGVQQQSSATPTPVRTAPLLTNCGTVTYRDDASDSTKARRLPWCGAGRTTHHPASLRQNQVNPYGSIGDAQPCAPELEPNGVFDSRFVSLSRARPGTTCALA